MDESKPETCCRSLSSISAAGRRDCVHDVADARTAGRDDSSRFGEVVWLRPRRDSNNQKRFRIPSDFAIRNRSAIRRWGDCHHARLSANVGCSSTAGVTRRSHIETGEDSASSVEHRWDRGRRRIGDNPENEGNFNLSHDQHYRADHAGAKDLRYSSGPGYRDDRGRGTFIRSTRFQAGRPWLRLFW